MNTSGASYDYPAGWATIVDTFKGLVVWQELVNNMEPVTINYIKERNGKLVIDYSGGNEGTDMLWMFAKAIAQKHCSECGNPATYTKFGPKCDQHI